MKIALIGRPNVGKSTLFNKLIGKRVALVHDMPGVTRDRRFLAASLFDLEFDVFDTPGVIPSAVSRKNREGSNASGGAIISDDLAKFTNEQSFEALKESDLLFFVIDAKDGVTEYDKDIASWIRKSFKKAGCKPVVVIKNKIDANHAFEDTSILGFDESIDISAEHNLGFDEIYHVLKKFDFGESPKDAKMDDEIKIAIIGRPNVGKSTLINSIIGMNRLVTSDLAGTTRDSISVNWTYKNKKFTLIDTAGQRRRSKVNEKIEFFSVADAWKNIKQANVALVVLDISSPLDNQDITIARKAYLEGKIVIFVLNKSDLVVDAERVLEQIKERLRYEFAQVADVECVLASGKDKLGLARIFNVTLKLYENWNKRISTSALNKWLQDAIAKNHPPLANGLPIKIKYASQVASRPPTFVLFANRVSKLPVSYERYLLNDLRRAFEFKGVPLRLSLKEPKNPYKD